MCNAYVTRCSVAVNRNASQIRREGLAGCVLG